MLTTDGINKFATPTRYQISDGVVNIARNTTKQFVGGNSNKMAGNFDGQGTVHGSLLYLQEVSDNY